MEWKVILKYQVKHEYELNKDDLSNSINAVQSWINKFNECVDLKEKNRLRRVLSDFITLFTSNVDCFILTLPKQQEIEKQLDSVFYNFTMDFDTVVIEGEIYKIEEKILNIDKKTIELKVQNGSIEKDSYEKYRNSIQENLKPYVRLIEKTLKEEK